MSVTTEMPPVRSCAVAGCTYNVGQGCHAKAITVGHGEVPACDTYLDAPGHTREAQRVAGVGACKVSTCQHNDDYECKAQGIAVDAVGASASCTTFAPR